MRQIFRLFFVLGFVFFTIPSAQASPGSPDYLCRDLPRETAAFQLAKIKGTSGNKIHFIKDDQWGEYDCPDSEKTNCEQKAYLIPGDTVIVSRVYKKWICSAYKNAKGDNTYGWLPLSAVEIQPTPQTPARELGWFGTWRNGKNWLQIDYAMEGSDIRVNGEAFWEGYPGNIHVATIGGFATPSGRSFEFIGQPPGCELKAYLLEPYLIVSDNVNCGGANVSFIGVYSK